ncbi:u3 small nucleolar RNA-interacting protein 2 [Trichonephila clavipes]|nr:u3 small nucleolar RNA-interacting protein 2 [Trichonephila clavipes]
MPKSNFFIRKSSGKSDSKKRKKSTFEKTPKKKIKIHDEEISSDSDASGHDTGYPEEISSEEETEQEKKLRLTKKYLSQLAEEEREKNDLDDTREAISRRLKEEALEEAGHLQVKKAHEYANVTPEVLAVLRGHKLSTTALVVSSSEKFIYSASKDLNLIKWSIEEQKKVKVINGGKKMNENKGPTNSILALALSDDDKFLASGCRNKMIYIWNAETLELLKVFKGHKDPVIGLVFLRKSHQLVSASLDRSLKLWNLDDMGYVDTLFGHQDVVTGIDCFFGETVLTGGGRDNTARIWKIVDESQLIFQGQGASIDCVCVSSRDSFVSGGDDGSLFLWGTLKKKPLSKIAEAHGIDEESETPNWIVSLTALQNTDLVATGSKDGFIRLWKRDDDSRSLVPISKIPVNGFVNSLKFSLSGKYLIAAHSKMSSASKKKTRQYSEEYLKFGFIPVVQDERIPFCLLCQQFLSNESMKRGRLEAHLKAKHSAHINSDLSYFKTLKENFEKRTLIKSLFTAHTSTNNRVLEASYQISLFIAKAGKNHTIGENLIKPSISAFLKTVLEKDDKDVKAMPLSKNTVSRRIDEMGEDIEKQLVEKLKTRKFSVQMDESTFRDSEAVLITYVRYIDKGHFAEEMFCKR